MQSGKGNRGVAIKEGTAVVVDEEAEGWRMATVMEELNRGRQCSLRMRMLFMGWRTLETSMSTQIR